MKPLPTKISNKVLESLPTTRLYITPGTFFTVPYINMDQSFQLKLERKYFTPNGKGIPWTCGVSNAVLDQKDLFPFPVLYVHTIGSTVYVVFMVDKGGLPKLAVRFRHRGGPLIEAYDLSRKNPRYEQKFLKLLEEHSLLTLERARHEQRKGAHGPGGAQARSTRKTGVVGNMRRAQNAGFIPPGFETAA